MLLPAHPYHLVERSPWPVTTSQNIGSLLIGTVGLFHGYDKSLIIILLSFINLILSLYIWWNDVLLEGTYIGEHTRRVRLGIESGIILFIISECLLFVGLFWAYLHLGLSPSIELGACWPPKGIEYINPLELPLLNTILLLSAGASVTWSHHYFMSAPSSLSYTKSVIGLSLGIILALIFTSLQIIEFSTAPFDISDSCFAAAFYLGTSFHGLHVIIGGVFLTIALIRMINFRYSATHHVGLLSALWYFHFTDVVWLLLYIVFYVWGFPV